MWPSPPIRPNIKKEYKIVSHVLVAGAAGLALVAFEKDVAESLEGGWRLAGPLVITPGGGLLYSQPMTKGV